MSWNPAPQGVLSPVILQEQQLVIDRQIQILADACLLSHSPDSAALSIELAQIPITFSHESE